MSWSIMDVQMASSNDIKLLVTPPKKRRQQDLSSGI